MNPVADLFHRILKERAAQPAVGADEITLTYGELFERVLAIDEFLRSQGVIRGDMIALNVKDELVHYLVSIALMMAGCRQVTYASHDSIDIFGRLDEILKPAFVITDQPGPVSRLKHIHVDSGLIDSDGSQYPRFSRSSISESFVAPAGSVLLKTSGTTGGFNIVEVPASDIRLQALRHPEYRQESLLRFASIEHNNSKRHRLYVFFNAGLNVFRRRSDDGWLNLVASGRLDILDISRLHILELLHRFQNGELADIKIRTGGSSIPASLRRDVMAHLSEKLFVRYAATEFGGIAMAEPGMHEIHGCSGRVLPGVEVQIVDNHDHILPAGAAGHVRVKGAGASGSYAYSEQEHASSARFRDGFFYPGDIGWMSESGLLIVEGRKDDMMIMNGLNIFPDEIQASLERIQGVREAVSFAVESRQHGQIPVAAVTLQPGVSLSETDLMLEAKKLLALKCPRRIYVLDALPVNSAGKFDKAELKSRLLKN